MKRIPNIYILLSLMLVGMTCQKEGFTPTTDADEVVQDDSQVQVVADSERQLTVSEAYANNKNVTISWLPEATSEQELGLFNPEGCNYDLPPNAYLYTDCEQMLEQAIGYFQVMANQTCTNLRRCITCNVDSQPMHAIIVVRHRCSILPPPAEF